MTNAQCENEAGRAKTSGLHHPCYDGPARRGQKWWAPGSSLENISANCAWRTSTSHGWKKQMWSDHRTRFIYQMLVAYIIRFIYIQIYCSTKAAHVDYRIYIYAMYTSSSSVFSLIQVGHGWAWPQICNVAPNMSPKCRDWIQIEHDRKEQWDAAHGQWHLLRDLLRQVPKLLQVSVANQAVAVDAFHGRPRQMQIGDDAENFEGLYKEQR